MKTILIIAGLTLLLLFGFDAVGFAVGLAAGLFGIVAGLLSGAVGIIAALFGSAIAIFIALLPLFLLILFIWGAVHLLRAI